MVGAITKKPRRDIHVINANTFNRRNELENPTPTIHCLYSVTNKKRFQIMFNIKRSVSPSAYAFLVFRSTFGSYLLPRIIIDT